MRRDASAIRSSSKEAHDASLMHPTAAIRLTALYVLRPSPSATKNAVNFDKHGTVAFELPVKLVQ